MLRVYDCILTFMMIVHNSLAILFLNIVLLLLLTPCISSTILIAYFWTYLSHTLRVYLSVCHLSFFCLCMSTCLFIYLSSCMPVCFSLSLFSSPISLSVFTSLLPFPSLPPFCFPLSHFSFHFSLSLTSPHSRQWKLLLQSSFTALVIPDPVWPDLENSVERFVAEGNCRAKWGVSHSRPVPLLMRITLSRESATGGAGVSVGASRVRSSHLPCSYVCLG